MSALPAEVRLAVSLLFGAPVAALLIGFFVLRDSKPEWTHWPILASCAATTAASAALAAYVFFGRGFDQPLWTWAVAGDWGLSFGLRVDGPSAAVLAMVTLVGALGHVYAAGSMRADPGFARFFLVFHLLFLAMIGLLTANDYVQLYLFWELAGLASYLLIGFWQHKAAARGAALRAFLTNRVGDLGFLLAVLALLATCKTTRLQLVYLYAAAGRLELAPLIAFGLVWAACARSAQWPLYFWLPDAMEGPTPSALMHAAAMATAGVFLLVRSWPLLSVVDGLPALVAWIGAVTSLGAAIIAASKKDLKRVLAYSTVSHLGLMMLALGLNQVGAAVFHLVAHGFFQAALFLCAGNIEHALHQPTANVDELGGLRRALPLTYACFWAAALSSSGVWPCAGFFSKGAILAAAWDRGGGLAAIGLLVALGSAFYIFRMLFLAFHGERPQQARSRAQGLGPRAQGLGTRAQGLGTRAREVEPELGVPTAFLALGAVCAGLLGAPLTRTLTSGWTLVPPGMPRLPGELALPQPTALVAGLGLLMAACGAALAYRQTMSDPSWDWRWRGGRVEAWLESDFGWRRVPAWIAGAAVLVGRSLR